MFKLLPLEDGYWGVFLVGLKDSDRYLLTSPLKKQDAEHFLSEFNRGLLQSTHAIGGRAASSVFR